MSSVSLEVETEGASAIKIDNSVEVRGSSAEKIEEKSRTERKRKTGEEVKGTR
ncbi:hypothetical protein WN48_03956 [Eufriesea mexicana]|nr:hypothetical protein WN48_03956 [Eufriesea mexicana]